MGHSRKGRAWAAFLATTLVAVVLVGLLAVHPSRAASAPRVGTDQLTVTVGANFVFTVSPDEITPGDTVDLSIVQLDSYSHTFTLMSVANTSLPTTDSASQVNDYVTAHPPLVNITIPTTAGTTTYTFTAPPLGYYQYVCLVAGHFQAGMAGFLGSGVAPPSAPSSTGPGAPVFIIGGTIVGLVVIAIVLGFVIGRRRGSHDEMPPERLGYPEPPLPSSPPPAVATPPTAK
jgi:plastocyanin